MKFDNRKVTISGDNPVITIPKVVERNTDFKPGQRVSLTVINGHELRITTANMEGD